MRDIVFFVFCIFTFFKDILIMSNVTQITTEKIMTLYMDYVLEHNANPKSVYQFAKTNDFGEQEFYQYFSSFEVLEKAIFAQFFVNTLSLLNKNEAYNAYESRDKLLSFYFTFFETLTANRSYVMYALKAENKKLKSLLKLETLREHFKTYITTLDIETITIKQERFQKFQEKSVAEGAWLQLLITLKFWMEDTSAAFEKTDVFIEKAINTSFDLIDTKPLKSIIDFGKFIIKEKVPFNI